MKASGCPESFIRLTLRLPMSRWLLVVVVAFALVAGCSPKIQTPSVKITKSETIPVEAVEAKAPPLSTEPR
jgi:uncharacterized protein YcfL